MWLKYLCRNLPIHAWPGCTHYDQVSPKPSGSEQPSSIISLMVWAGGAVEQPTITVNMAALYPDGNVPPKLTGTQLYGRFKKEWDRDPELGEMKRPSKSTLLRKLGKKT